MHSYSRTKPSWGNRLSVFSFTRNAKRSHCFSKLLQLFSCLSGPSSLPFLYFGNVHLSPWQLACPGAPFEPQLDRRTFILQLLVVSFFVFFLSFSFSLLLPFLSLLICTAKWNSSYLLYSVNRNTNSLGVSKLIGEMQQRSPKAAVCLLLYEDFIKVCVDTVFMKTA